MNASPFKLYAANSTVINTYGQKLLTLNLGLRRECQWPFIIADVKMAIIGADFIAYHNLLIDLRRQCLIDSVTSLSSQGKSLKTTQPSLSTVNASQPHASDQSNSYAQLLAEYADITKPNFGERTEATTQVAHHIVTNGHPVALRPRKLVGDKLTAAKQQINAMLEQGILRPSSSPWASPIHMEKKNQETGDPAAIIATSTPRPSRIVTGRHSSRTSFCNFTVNDFFSH